MSIWLIGIVLLAFLLLVGGTVVVGVLVWATGSSWRDDPDEEGTPVAERPPDTDLRGEGAKTDPRACPRCAVELPADAPEGLCPRCLLLGAIDTVRTPPPAEAEGPERTEAYAGPNAAPPVEELQAHFPQLEVLELLGQGGMGAVYKARQPGLDRLVALKVLPPELGRDPAFAERFQREARALARLSHPNIVGIHDVGQAGELYFFVMEYVDGVNLRQLLTGKLLRPEQALQIIPQICDALEYAHEEGIVHRDIKPENILLDKKGRVKIADFGLAKLVGRERNLTLTGTRQVMGTLYYMAPEQMERPLEVDHRADIYSLGVVFYEMLTGELPVGRFAIPSEKAGTPADLDAVVLRALEKEPDRRFQRASDVKTSVEGVSGRARRAGPPAAEAPRRTTAPGEIRGRVQAPGIALMITGILYLVSLPVSVLFGLMPMYDDVGRPPPGAGPAAFLPAEAVPLASLDPAGAPAPLPFAFLGFGTAEMMVQAVVALFGVVMILSSVNILQLRSYPLALVGAILAVLPCSPCCVAGLPVGVWVLVVITNPEVRAAFASLKGV